jgi:hypothetical protein
MGSIIEKNQRSTISCYCTFNTICLILFRISIMALLDNDHNIVGTLQRNLNDYVEWYMVLKNYIGEDCMKHIQYSTYITFLRIVTYVRI